MEFANEKYGYTDDEILVISGLGSGMNFNKPGIDKLIRMMIRREFRGAKIMVENIDRLICIAQRFLYVAADETGITTEVMSEDDNSEENLKLFFADCISCLHVKSFICYSIRANDRIKVKPSESQIRQINRGHKHRSRSQGTSIQLE